MKAIKDINFLPGYVLQRQLKAKRKVTITVWIFICAVIAVGLYILPIQVYNYYQAESDNYKIQLSKLSEVQQKVNELKVLRENKNKKKALIEKINSKQVKVVENIDKINNNLPQDVSMRSCIFSEKEFNSYFVVDSPLQVVDLLDRLEKLNIFKKITIISSPIVDENAIINVRLELK